MHFLSPPPRGRPFPSFSAACSRPTSPAPLRYTGGRREAPLLEWDSMREIYGGGSWGKGNTRRGGLPCDFSHDFACPTPTPVPLRIIRRENASIPTDYFFPFVFSPRLFPFWFSSSLAPSFPCSRSGTFWYSTLGERWDKRGRS